MEQKYIQKNRLEAFSDGVIAIIITIMVLEIKVPKGGDLESLKNALAVFPAYILSYLYISIYWNNHHHLINTVKNVNAKIMWANCNLLFWLSLVPFATSWAGANYTQSLPTAFYGIILLMSGISYKILQNSIVSDHGKGSSLEQALGKDLKGISSLFTYFIAIPIAFYNLWISNILYFCVALMWLIPDRRLVK